MPSSAEWARELNGHSAPQAVTDLSGRHGVRASSKDGVGDRSESKKRERDWRLLYRLIAIENERTSALSIVVKCVRRTFSRFVSFGSLARRDGRARSASGTAGRVSRR